MPLIRLLVLLFGLLTALQTEAAVVAWYPLDESAWNGSAGEIADASGNGHDGRAVGGAASVAGGRVCRGGSIPPNTTDGAQDAIDTGIDLDGQVGPRGTISFWFRSAVGWSGNGDRMLFDASNDASGKYFFLMLRDSGRLRFRLEDSSDADFQSNGSVRAFPAGEWHHIAVTWDMPAGRMRSYIDGVLDGSVSFSSNGVLGNMLSLFVGDNRGGYHPGGSAASANGLFDEVRVYNHVQGSAEITADMNATRPCPLQPIAEYRFDECSYSGLPGEAEDSQGNYPGTPLNGVNTNRPGVINGYLDQNLNTHQVGHINYIPMNGAWSVSVWFRTPFVTTQRFHFLGGMSDTGEPLLMLDRDANYRWAVIVLNPGSFAYGSFRFDSLTDGWHHLVLVGTDQGPMGETELYIDGSFIERLNLQVRGNLISLGPSNFGGDVRLGVGFGTALDEFTIFDYALSADEIAAIRRHQLNGLNVDGSDRAPVSCRRIDHFSINVGAGNASTCAPFSFSITAEDSSNSPVTDYDGTVTVTTSSGHGNFAVVSATNNLSPNPDTDDNGSVSYTFDSADNGHIDLSLSNARAETLRISVTDSAIPLTSTSADVTFRDNAFEIVDVDSAVAGDNVPVAGRNHAYRIRLQRKDPSSGQCGVATAYQGSRSLKLWRVRNAADPGGAAPSLAGVALPDSEPAGANASILFTAGEADVMLTSSDIGKYTLEAKDVSRSFADIDIAGGSAEQTLRPFGLAIDFSAQRNTDFADNGLIDDSTGSDLSYAADAAGSVFTQAGEAFPMTVSGVLWQAADDADNNGLPDAGAWLGDNSVAPSFGAEGESVVAEVSVRAPAGASAAPLVVDGVAGGLFSGFASGSQTASVQYGNVGIIDIRARLADNDYFGSGVAVGGAAPNVGRFNPWQYAVTSSSLTPACSTGSPFTYAREPFELALTLQAQNRAGALTDGYRGAFVTLDIASELNIRNDRTGLAYDEEAYSIVEDFGSGTAGEARFTLQLAWDMPLQAPTLSRPELVDSSDEVNRIAGSPYVLGQTEIRFGRMVLENSHGSELLDLPLPMRAEYYDGSNFLINADDSCSRFTVNRLRLDSAVENAQTDGDIQVLPGQVSRATIAHDPLLAGDAGLSLCPPGNPACTPGAGNEGWVDLQLDLGLRPWLRFDWNGDGLYDDDPKARATFGIYRGNDRQIHLRRLFD